MSGGHLLSEFVANYQARYGKGSALELRSTPADNPYSIWLERVVSVSFA
jgi:hypothetical protein